MSRIPAAVCVAATLLGAAESGAEPVNPFARPYAAAEATTRTETLTPAERPTLRGVIVAGADSIANLNGTLLAIGEEEAGYRLESVAEDRATFRFRDKPVTLLLEPPTDSAEQAP